MKKLKNDAWTHGVAPVAPQPAERGLDMEIPARSNLSQIIHLVSWEAGDLKLSTLGAIIVDTKIKQKES